MRERCDKKAKEIELKKKELEGSISSLLPEYHKIKEQINNALSCAANIRNDLMKANGENKAVILLGYIDKIRVYFDAGI